ncbi:MAG: UbiX family flavin prenyltransferase [Acidobacteria bacterium]|nr:UbiX family flavin prenyltransferase [Acidobacteriota bacterium]MCI0719734.1 UbiX family flavin prenyltransferase [Acidobacteriota bacterium]
MNITVAITGASGAIYPQRFLNHLAAEPGVSRIQLVASAPGLRVLHEELGGAVTLSNVAERLVEDGREKVEVLSNNDVGASIASGSFPVDAMVIIPCSVGTLGAIAHGISRDLIQRAADVMLKERRKLILVIRDTPFSLIHLENMRLLTLAGGTIFPAIPSFYHRPGSIEDAVDQFLFRVMTHLGLKPARAYQWKGSKGGIAARRE